MVLGALARLVVFESVVDWVGDLREGLLLLAEAELFLLNFNLMRYDYVAIQVHRLDQDRHNELLDNALLLVVDDDSHVRAFVDFVAGQGLVGDRLMVRHRPVVVQQAHAVKQDGEDHASHGEKVLLVRQLPAELIEEREGHHTDRDKVNALPHRYTLQQSELVQLLFLLTFLHKKWGV